MSVLDWVPLEDRLVALVADRFGEVELKKPLRWAGSDVIGDDSMGETSGELAGVLRKLLEMDAESEPSAERNESLDEALEMVRMSGALSAWTLVVEMSSVGKEMLDRLMVPAAYLKEASEGAEEASWCRFARFVRALASAIVEEDI